MITLSLLFALCSYFGIYFEWFKYLGDLVGYSLLNNVFMYLYYVNKHFCTSTKIAVLGLISLNIFNLIYLWCGVNGGLYDLILLSIIIMILVFLKVRK